MYILYRFEYNEKSKKYVKKSQSLQVSFCLVSGVIWPLTFKKYTGLRISSDATRVRSALFALAVLPTWSLPHADTCAFAKIAQRQKTGNTVQFADQLSDRLSNMAELLIFAHFHEKVQRLWYLFLVQIYTLKWIKVRIIPGASQISR